MEKSELVCDGIYVNIDMIRKNLGILHNDERRMMSKADFAQFPISYVSSKPIRLQLNF